MPRTHYNPLYAPAAPPLMVSPGRRWAVGVGGLAVGSGLGNTGTGTGTRVATTAVGTAATIAGSNAAAIAGTLGVAVPVVGTAIAGIAMAVTAWLNRMGPKQKRWTTQIADEATAQLQAIKSTYFAEPYNPANQAAALAAVDQMLQAIQDGCGQPQMGEPGRRCIAERLVRGGSAPWCPTGTGCDYFTEYRDPIANDARAAEWRAAVTANGGATPGDGPLTNGALAAGGLTAVFDAGFVPLALAGLAAVFVVRSLRS